jgi:hypothetical protein
VFEKRVLRRIFGLKRDEVARLEKLPNEEHMAYSTMGRSGTHIRYWWESQKEIVNIKMDLR